MRVGRSVAAEGPGLGTAVVARTAEAVRAAGTAVAECSRGPGLGVAPDGSRRVG